MASIDKVTKTRFANDKHRFATNIVYTANWIKNLSEAYLKPYGLSNQQFNILRILRGANDWVSMNDVKDLMIDKSPNATRLADKLKNKGLIQRRRSETDRRIVYLHISPEGLELLAEMDKTGVNVLEEAFDRISDEEATLVSGILDRFRG